VASRWYSSATRSPPSRLATTHRRSRIATRHPQSQRGACGLPTGSEFSGPVQGSRTEIGSVLARVPEHLVQNLLSPLRLTETDLGNAESGGPSACRMQHAGVIDDNEGHDSGQPELGGQGGDFGRPPARRCRPYGGCRLRGGRWQRMARALLLSRDRRSQSDGDVLAIFRLSAREVDHPDTAPLVCGHEQVAVRVGFDAVLLPQCAQRATARG